MAEAKAKTPRQIVTTVFSALVLDLLAFTLPLPLFPRLIAWFLQKESHESSTLLSRLLQATHSWRALLVSKSSFGAPGSDTLRQWTDGQVGNTKNWDIVLLGGAMGSLFSICQCVISPSLGSLSDRYGRKKVLLATMLGNILSAVIWLRSTTFSTYLLSRLVGGLSEGNVQLSTAIISDVTSPATRSKSLALVGIAFSICFTLGPSLGAYFASRPLPLTATTSADKWNVYATPAAISLGLLVLETVFLAVKLPETLQWKKDSEEGKTEEKKEVVVKEPASSRLARLRMIGWYHFAFLLFFSGAEFTLTFLTYDLFAATNAQNGRLLSYIGVLSAYLQARHVRPSLAKRGELKVASTGLTVSVLAFLLLAALPIPSVRASPGVSTSVLYAAATALAYVSATVVTGLTAAAAACCDEEGEGGSDENLRRGRALGSFRSKGQLGRAIGPLLASSIYWVKGPMFCYGGIALCIAQIVLRLRRWLKKEDVRRQLAGETKKVQ